MNDILGVSLCSVNETSSQQDKKLTRFEFLNISTGPSFLALGWWLRYQ